MRGYLGREISYVTCEFKMLAMPESRLFKLTRRLMHPAQCGGKPEHFMGGCCRSEQIMQVAEKGCGLCIRIVLHQLVENLQAIAARPLAIFARDGMQSNLPRG